jgi:hypothetical protein
VITAQEILLGYDFYRRRMEQAPPAHIPAVRAGLVFAREIAQSEEDEPAALFFVFAVQRHAFGEAWEHMACSIAVKQARLRGWWLPLERQQPEVRMYLDGMSGYPFEDVRAFVAERLARSLAP